MSQLRYELTTDKPLRVLTDDGLDADLWNRSLNELQERIGVENSTWFKAPWLFTECYMYRRIREALLLCKSKFRFYDAYIESKKEAYNSTEKTIISLFGGLCSLNVNNDERNFDELKSKHENILLVSLWSNKNDLSLSSGQDNGHKTNNLLEQLEHLKKYLLVNQTNEIWEHVVSVQKHEGKQLRRFDLILDNTSMEFIADLILSDFLLRNNLFDQVNLHAKSYSWFVSDVTPDDFDFVIERLQRVNSLFVNQFLIRLKTYQREKRLNFTTNSFWTSPYSFAEMRRIDESLYEELSKSDLLLMKGDLNYRKLLGDLDWPHDTPLSVAIQDFNPCSFAALRTLKCDLVANLNLNDAHLKQVKENDKNWMISGDYGIIQFLKKEF